MTEGIMIAMITGGLAVISNIIVVAFNNSKTLYRVEQLERKMEKHNNFIERVYELERIADVHEEKFKVANHRIEDLETR
jgi:hypothetical protein